MEWNGMDEWNGTDGMEWMERNAPSELVDDTRDARDASATDATSS